MGEYSVVSNPKEFNRGLDLAVERFEKKFKTIIRMLMTRGMAGLLRRTPVHTGQAAMSYIASVGVPGTGYGDGFTAVQATNRLPLGSEILRPRAEAVSRATLAMVSYDDPYKVFWIVNNAPDISGLEAGRLPKEPYVPRSPQGMFGVTLQELLLALGSA